MTSNFYVKVPRKCRVCDKAEERTKEGGERFCDIFDDLSLIYDLNFTTGIAIVHLKKFPRQLICTLCRLQLRSFANFRRKALQIDRRIRERFFNAEQSLWKREQQSLDSLDEQSQPAANTNDVVVKEEPEFVLEVTEGPLKYINETVKHEKGEEEEEKKPRNPKTGDFYCRECDRHFSSARGYEVHMVVTHDRSNRVYLCRHCGHFFKMEMYLRKHVVRRHQKTYDRGTDMQIKVVKDRSSASSKPQKSIKPEEVEDYTSQACCVCNKVFSSVKSCRSHILIAHADLRRVFACKHCRKKCKLKEYMRKHVLRAHLKTLESSDYSTTDDSDAHCDDAYEAIASEIVDRTKPSKLVERRTFCEICRQNFSKYSVYEEHVKIRHARDNTEYVCSVCDRGFVVLSYLKRHMRQKHAATLKLAEVVTRQSDGRRRRKRPRLWAKPAENSGSEASIDDMMESIPAKS